MKELQIQRDLMSSSYNLTESYFTSTLIMLTLYICFTESRLFYSFREHDLHVILL